MKTAETSDFNPVILCQGIGDFIKEEVDDLCGLCFGKTVLILERIDQVRFVHESSFLTGKYSSQLFLFTEG
jgi:hypothetical protein